MTDERLDRKVRDADPYRPEIADRLAGADQRLLEEIMSEPQPRRGVLRRAAFTLAAAAVLITVIAISLTVRGQQSAPRAIVPPAGPTAEKPMVMTPAAWQKMAEESPRLLIQQAGWTVKYSYGFADQQGSMTFSKGGQTLEMNWYPAKHYEDYRRDRKAVSKPEPATVDGWKGTTVTYSATDFATMLKPRDGVFVELRGQGVADRAAYEELLGTIKRVDVKTWLGALPADIVTPDKAQAVAAAVLADIPLPPGFDPEEVRYEGTNDRYQFGARVTSEVGCRWIAEFERAKKAGDRKAMDKAAAAMKSSHGWKVLNDMNAEGDWPEVFWEYSDQIAQGTVPNGYKEGIGCGTSW